MAICCGSDVVGGNGHLGEVVEQVVGEDLDGRHGQEGQPGAGADDAEHVAEVRAGAHADVLEDVDEDLAAFQHAFLQHHQALFQQDDIGRFLGDIHGVIDGDADIGGAQGRGVVDAVAHEPDDVALALEGLDDALLVRRGEAREDVGGLDGLGQLRRRSSSRPGCRARSSRR